jgi:hypothetical protein
VPFLAKAQTEKPTERVLKSFQLSAHGLFDFQGKDGGNLYVQNFFLFAPSEEARAYNPEGRVFTGFRTRAGYELPFSEKLFGGAQLQYRYIGNSGNFSVRPYLLRYGKISGVTFGQRLLYQFEKSNNSLQKDGSFANLALFLEKNFDAGGKRLSANLSFELSKDLTRKTKGTERRFISGSVWVLNINYAFAKDLTVGFFAQYATNYFFALALYDENGKEIKPDRKLNINELHSGLVLRYHIRNHDKQLPVSLIF